MEQTSIHPDTMPWMLRLTARLKTPTASTAWVRLSFNFSWRVAAGASKRLIKEVKPANSAATKNTAMMTRPPGMAPKRFGRKMNISPGPLLSSVCPAVAMAGMMTSAASTAAAVSKNATVRADAGTSASRAR